MLFIFIYLVNVPGPLAQYINLTNQRFEAYMSFLFWIIETCCLVKNKNTQVVFQSVFTMRK